jgi:hypothetical protein
MSDQKPNPVNAVIAFAGQRIDTGGTSSYLTPNGFATGISGGCTKSAASNVDYIMVGSWLPFP